MLIRLLNCVRVLYDVPKIDIYIYIYILGSSIFKSVIFLGGEARQGKIWQARQEQTKRGEARQDKAHALRVTQAETRLAVYRLL